MSASAKEPTVRIIWYRGQAYPITNAPLDTLPSATWYISINGEWQELFTFDRTAMDGAAWRELETRAIDWLDRHVNASLDRR